MQKSNGAQCIQYLDNQIEVSAGDQAVYRIVWGVGTPQGIYDCQNDLAKVANVKVKLVKSTNWFEIEYSPIK